MRNKNGFTLVELLAVIVILAIIMIIAIPNVLDVLTTARKKTFVEYMTKVVNLAEEKEIKSGLFDNSTVHACTIYNIKTDLGLSSTGSYNGYILLTYDYGTRVYTVTLWDSTYMIYAYNYTKKWNYMEESQEPIDAVMTYDESQTDKLSTSYLCGYGCASCTLANNGSVNPEYPEEDDNDELEWGTEFAFNYTGDIQEFVVPTTGIYIFEVWGAQGGNANNTYTGGLGGYSKGQKALHEGDILYIVVGGQGECSKNKETMVNGGFNGGGSAKARSGSYIMCAGGGATHVGTYRATLEDTGADKLDTIYIVAGGGGGAGYYSGQKTGSKGGDGGGTNGLVPSNNCADCQTRTGGSQTKGGTGRSGTGSFGRGIGIGTAVYSCGGGGGLYGGGADQYEWGGYGGSGYINYDLNRKSTEASKNTGNGKAVITYDGPFR